MAAETFPARHLCLTAVLSSMDDVKCKAFMRLPGPAPGKKSSVCLVRRPLSGMVSDRLGNPVF